VSAVATPDRFGPRPEPRLRADRGQLEGGRPETGSRWPSRARRKQRPKTTWTEASRSAPTANTRGSAPGRRFTTRRPLAEANAPACPTRRTALNGVPRTQSRRTLAWARGTATAGLLNFAAFAAGLEPPDRSTRVRGDSSARAAALLEPLPALSACGPSAASSDRVENRYAVYPMQPRRCRASRSLPLLRGTYALPCERTRHPPTRSGPMTMTLGPAARTEIGRALGRGFLLPAAGASGAPHVAQPPVRAARGSSARRVW